MDKQRCEHCGSIISEREIALFDGMVSALWQVYKYCLKAGKYEFTRKEIKGLLENESQSARFGDWVMFGGLVFKYGKGRYGLNITRCDDFFAGKYAIATRIWKNPITGELRKEDHRFISEIPALISLLNGDGEYVARYRKIA